MLKSEAETHIKRLCDAIGSTIRQTRPTGQECKCCGAFAGSKHLDDCVLWPIIWARAAVRVTEQDLTPEPDEAV